jgi:hypothetical protein
MLLAQVIPAQAAPFFVALGLVEEGSKKHERRTDASLPLENNFAASMVERSIKKLPPRHFKILNHEEITLILFASFSVWVHGCCVWHSRSIESTLDWHV